MSIPTVTPKSVHTATVIFLHGLGDTGHGWCSALQEISEPYIKYMCPTAPSQKVTLNGGMKMPSWFDIASLDFRGAEDEAGIKAAAADVKQLVDKEVQNGIPTDRILIGGFSQGGAVALYTALTCGKQLAGMIGLSCFLPLHKQFPEALVSTDTPFFLAHGDVDPVVNVAFGKMTHEILRKMNCKVDFQLHRGLGHSSNEKEMMEVQNFIRRVLPKTS